MKKRVVVECSAELPMVPNFIRVSHNGAELTLDVADMPDTTLERIGKEWVAALLEHAKQRRKARGDQEAR